MNDRYVHWIINSGETQEISIRKRAFILMKKRSR